MSARMLARRIACQTPVSRVSAGRRFRPCKLTVKAYLGTKDGNRETVKETVDLKEKAKVTFQLPHHVEYGQDMCLIGEDPALGGWDISKCVPMAWHEGDFWTAEAELPAGAKVEYKYVIRAAEDMGGGVLEWQPCFNMQLEAEEPEVTVRDAWEGSAHEILPGTLPVPVPEPVEEAVLTVANGDALVAVNVDADADSRAVAQLAAVADNVIPLVVEEPVTAEDVAAAAAPVADSSGDEYVLTAEAIIAAAAMPAPPATNGRGKDTRRRSTGSKAPKGVSINGTKAAASMTVSDWESLATSQLKEMCKKKGLATKGQRRDLLARLQQHGA